MVNDCKSDWFTRTMLMILIGIISWLWIGMDRRLAVIECRLRRVELNQAKILTHLGIEPVVCSVQDRPGSPNDNKDIPKTRSGQRSSIVAVTLSSKPEKSVENE